MSDMTDMTDTAPPVDPPTEIHRHPIRAFFWSIPFALGLVLVLVVTKVIELSLTPMISVFIIALTLGTIWGFIGPAKKPKGPPPTPVATVEPEISRFDDFTDAIPASEPGPMVADAGEPGADARGDGGD